MPLLCFAILTDHPYSILLTSHLQPLATAGFSMLSRFTVVRFHDVFHDFNLPNAVWQSVSDVPPSRAALFRFRPPAFCSRSIHLEFLLGVLLDKIHRRPFCCVEIHIDAKNSITVLPEIGMISIGAINDGEDLSADCCMLCHSLADLRRPREGFLVRIW